MSTAGAPANRNGVFMKKNEKTPTRTGRTGGAGRARCWGSLQRVERVSREPTAFSMKAAVLGLGCFAAYITNVSGFVSQFRSTGLGRFGPRAPLASESSTLRMTKGATNHVSFAHICLLSVGTTFANATVEKLIPQREFCRWCKRVYRTAHLRPCVKRHLLMFLRMRWIYDGCFCSKGALIPRGV